MNRQQTLEALKNIASKLAEEKGLDIMTSQDISLALWDNPKFTNSNIPLSEIIKSSLEEQGEKYQEVHFTKVPYENYDLKKDYKVTLGYWFREPKISAGVQWGKEGYAGLTFINQAKEGEPENYEMSSSQIFQETGIAIFNRIMEYWNEERDKIMALENESQKNTAGIKFEGCDIVDIDNNFVKLYPNHEDMIRIAMRATDPEQGSSLKVLSKYGCDPEKGTSAERLDAIEKLLADDVATEVYADKISGDVRFCVLDEGYDSSCLPNMCECEAILDKIAESERVKELGKKLMNSKSER